MMEFRVRVALPQADQKITPADSVLFVGSCFAENVGRRFTASGFDGAVNPFGVLYNPVSIRNCMLLAAVFGGLDPETVVGPSVPTGLEPYHTGDIFFEHGGLWSSWWNDSTFSRETQAACKDYFDGQFRAVGARLKTASWLFITLGTNRCYELAADGMVVGNCHKQPGYLFKERALTLEETIGQLSQTVKACLLVNPRLQIGFTVSPYRYAKYGFHESQLGKAVLLLAVDALCRTYPACCSYFPAYELLLDELRDYRFYKEDMLHPSDQAVSYIWDCFRQCYFDEASCRYAAQWEALSRALAHRPLHPESEAYRQFLCKTMLKIETLQKKYPNFAIEKERARLAALLEQFPLKTND